MAILFSGAPWRSESDSFWYGCNKSGGDAAVAELGKDSAQFDVEEVIPQPILVDAVERSSYDSPNPCRWPRLRFTHKLSKRREDSTSAISSILFEASLSKLE